MMLMGVDMEETGNRIKLAFEAAQMTREEVAEEIGVSTQAVSKWYLGKCLPTIDNMVLISFKTGETLDDLIAVKGA